VDSDRTRENDYGRGLPKDVWMILIVEDDADISASLQQFLELEGYKSEIARNGKEAVDFLKDSEAKATSPCVILLDLMMPVMDGWQFLTARQGEPSMSKIPVIVMSAARLSDKVQNVSATLKKPIDLDQLMSLLKQHCHGSC
jgi:DNA-binding response OmpR family regulator